MERSDAFAAHGIETPDPADLNELYAALGVTLTASPSDGVLMIVVDIVLDMTKGRNLSGSDPASLLVSEGGLEPDGFTLNMATFSSLCVKLVQFGPVAYRSTLRCAP